MPVATLLFFLLITLCSYPPVAKSAPVLGYGFSDAVIATRNQVQFLAGFELGLKQELKKKLPSDFLLLQQSTDGSSLGASKVARSLLANNISILTGFVSSHEALQASKLAVQSNTLFLSGGAGHTKISQFGPTVFSVGVHMAVHTSTMLKFLKKHFSKKTGYLISYKEAVFSMNQEEVFLKSIKNPAYASLDIKPIYLNKDRVLSKETLQLFKQKKPDYFILTAYADECADLLLQLEQNHIDIPILSNYAWPTVDIELLRRLLTYKKAPLYATIEWIRGTSYSRPFERAVRKTYGRPASAEIAWGYNAGVIVATTLNRVKGTPTKKAILKAFHQNRCFSRTAAGTICFHAQGGNAIGKLHLAKFTVEQGFVPVPQ